MESKKKVLIAGIGQSNFLKQLYSAIHKVAPNTYEFDIYGLNELSGKDEYGVEVFNKVYPVRNRVLLGDFRNLFNLKLAYQILQFFRYGLTAKKAKDFISRFIITKSQFKEYNFERYDIVHIHFPTFQKLDILWHLPSDVKCIVSFWGSDLMRSKGMFSYFVQDIVTKRADIITTHGNELKQQILTKFGRHLDRKILYTRFPAFDKLYLLIEETIEQPKESLVSFFHKYRIPVDKKIVVVGHNGTRENNHIQILECLKRLPKEIKEGAFFILPFSYKASKDGSYEAKCISTLEDAELQGILLKDFLSWEDLAKLKRITDIMIHMPVSDALSGAMTEALFAGSEVITANWLPYSPFISEGLIFKSTDFENLECEFMGIYNALSKNESVAQRNREIIKNRFLSDYCAKTWLPIFES